MAQVRFRALVTQLLLSFGSLLCELLPTFADFSLTFLLSFAEFSLTFADFSFRRDRRGVMACC